MTKVSVIVPVYNAEKAIERCIRSILDQEYQDIECIAVDDGSKDASGEKIYRDGYGSLAAGFDGTGGIRRSEYAGFPGCRGAPPDY